MAACGSGCTTSFMPMSGLCHPCCVIESADEFVRLRTSTNPAEYHRAANDEAAEQTWIDVIERYPNMRSWVAHNKTVPLSILEILRHDTDEQVRLTVTGKRSWARRAASCSPRVYRSHSSGANSLPKSAHASFSQRPCVSKVMPALPEAITSLALSGWRWSPCRRGWPHVGQCGSLSSAGSVIQSR